MKTLLTPYGNITYRIDRRSPKRCLLIFNGAFTTVDMRDAEQYFIHNDYTIICIARPGYANTKFGFANEPGVFEKAVSEVLKKESISKTHVLGISVGGRSAMRFVSAYPQLCSVLLLYSSASFSNWQNKINGIMSKMFLGTVLGKVSWFIFRFMLRISPYSATAFILSSLTTKDAKKVLSTLTKQEFEDMRNMFMQCRSSRGVAIDTSKGDECGDPTCIQTPTYIFHSRYDAAVPSQHPQVLAGQISGSKLLFNETDSHLMWFSPRWIDVEKQLDQILKQY